MPTDDNQERDDLVRDLESLSEESAWVSAVRTRARGGPAPVPRCQWITHAEPAAGTKELAAWTDQQLEQPPPEVLERIKRAIRRHGGRSSSISGRHITRSASSPRPSAGVVVVRGGLLVAGDGEDLAQPCDLKHFGGAGGWVGEVSSPPRSRIDALSWATNEPR